MLTLAPPVADAGGREEVEMITKVMDCRGPGHVYAIPWAGEVFPGSCGYGLGLAEVINGHVIDNEKVFAVATPHVFHDGTEGFVID